MNTYQRGDALIAVCNRSTLYPDAKLPALVRALQAQVSGEFAAAWGVNAGLVAIGRDEEPPPGAWQLILLDDPDQAGVLGYHELTADGQPLGKVFVGLDAKYNVPDGLTASHELLEMLADSNANTFDRAANGDFYIREVCDPVNMWWYPIGKHDDGTPIFGAYFVTPSWFTIGGQPPYAAPSPADQVVSAPFMLAPGLFPGQGGYIAVVHGTEWVQLQAENIRARDALAANYGRRAMRMLPRDQWKRSVA